MKSWPLRLKLTAWSAVLTGLVLLLAGLATTFYVRQEQIEALDDQLRNEAHTFFGEINRWEDRMHWDRPKEVERILPLTRSKRFVEVYAADGKLLAHSGTFASGTFARHAEGIVTREVEGHSVRLGVFQKRGLRLCLGAALSEIDADASGVRLLLYLGLPTCVGLMAAGGWWLARKALAPMRELTFAVEHITAQRLSHRLPLMEGSDEVARLSRVLNATFDRLDASFRQAVRFTADASHELKTPLAVMRAMIESQLDSSSPGADNRAEAAVLLEQTRRLTGIIESLLLLAHADSGHLALDRTNYDLCEIISACAEDATIFAEERAIHIRLSLPPILVACIDSARVSQILLNLLVNAVKYNVTEGEVLIQAGVVNRAPVIRISNTGAGIPIQAQEHLFERFYRADPAGDRVGHGLGLSLARELARAHGGDVMLERSDTSLTTFVVSFDSCETSASTPQKTKP